MQSAFKAARTRVPIVILLVFVVALSGCAKGKRDSGGYEKTLRLATSTSALETGLLDELLASFERDSGIKTKVYAYGSGKALELGRKGEADVVLTHSRSAEDRFIAEGYGVNEADVMYNDFVLLGPLDDAAGLKGGRDIVKAFRTIASKGAGFVSRGDRSGTNAREAEIWDLAGIETKGEWYRESKKGMLETLQMASREKSYCLSNRSTYIINKKKLGLQIVVEGDKRLINPYRVIAVNPEKVTGVNYKNAMALIDFLLSERTQTRIREYGIKETGQELFFPSAERKG